jgi:DNA-binding IclR family transcriptional regulator
LLLDKIPYFSHTVHMIEPPVQQSEHQEPPSESGSTAVAAPMVERAFRLLGLLSTSEEGLTLSELARALEMSKGSIHGLLKTLEITGAVEQASERQYILGPRIYELAQTSLQQAGLRRLALPAMQRLAANLGETIVLGRVEDKHVRILESVDASNDSPSLHISAPRGTRVPLLAGAIGRVVLASWPLAEREAYLRARPLPGFTPHSITDPEQFLQAIEQSARQGIGEDRQEYLVGVNAVAAPILSPDKTLLALLWVVGFSARLDEQKMRQAGQALQIETQAISQSLGAAGKIGTASSA